MRVFLVRHAEAAPGEPDALRPLTPAGHETARALGEVLAREHPDAIVTSPLRRARETAAAIAEAAGLDAAVPDDGMAPGATVASLREAVAGRGATIVAVGHQPDCGNIVEELTGERRPFAPGAHVELEL